MDFLTAESLAVTDILLNTHTHTHTHTHTPPKNPPALLKKGTKEQKYFHLSKAQAASRIRTDCCLRFFASVMRQQTKNKLIPMNRILITALLSATCSLAVQAQQATETVVFKFKARNNMFFLRGNETEIERLYSFTDRYHAEITGGQMPVRVDGYCSDLKIARIRSNRIKSQLIMKKRLKEEHFITRNHAGSHHGEKDVVVVSFIVKDFKSSKDLKNSKDLKSSQDTKETEQPVEQPKPQPVEQPQFVEQPQPETGEMPVQTSVSENRRKFSLRTNLLYWAVATPNLGIEWKPSSRTGILVNGAYSHWVWNSDSKQHRTWLVQPEIRRYPGESRRWFAGVEAHAGEFNFKFGDTGYQGEAFGGGITGGYRLQLSKHLDMDFSLGLGYTHLKYDTYYRSNNVMVRRESGVKKNLFAPTQAGVSIIWNLDLQD
jgi:hypothetical protein